MATTTLGITGMHCAGCVASVEKSLQSVPGVIQASVNLATSEARIEHDPAQSNVQHLIDAVKAAGYSAQQIAGDDPLHCDMDHAHHGQGWVIWFAAAGVGMMIMALMLWKSQTSAWMQLVLATPMQIIIGAPFYRGAWAAVKRMRADMDTLVALGTSVAFAYSMYATVAYTESQSVYFETAAMILVLISLGKLLETRARSGAMAAIVGLAKMQPDRATVIRHGKQDTIPTSQLVAGDTVIVRPGQRLPVDGVITEGQSAIDQSLVTGEAQPVEVTDGDQVIGGTINQSGAFRMRATSIGTDTVLAQIVKMVRDAQTSKAKVQRTVDKVAAVFVPVVLLLAVQTFVGWVLIGGQVSHAISSTVAVLIVACPCALGLATPMAIMVGTGMGARYGVLIKDAQALERAGKLTDILLDKTGTLTLGRFTVAQVVSNDRAISEEQLLRLAACVEDMSEHPIGRSIVASARQRHIELAPVIAFQTLAVGGVSGRVEGKVVIVGRLPLLRDKQVRNVDDLVEAREQMRNTSRTVVAVAIDRWAVGLIGLNDEIKPEAQQVIQQLKALKLKVLMLTGDSEAAAQHIADRLDIDAYLSQVTTGDKHKNVTQLKEQGRVVAMVGDGINDAPALAAADVGIAMGGRTQQAAGSDIAASAGHVVLVGGNLHGLVRAITLSRATMRRIYAGLLWACIYNMVLIPVAMAGKLNPMFAAAAMSASSICVVFNALWLRRKWKP